VFTTTTLDYFPDKGHFFPKLTHVSTAKLHHQSNDDNQRLKLFFEEVCQTGNESYKCERKTD
jgi:hypothetical protein